MRRMGVVHLVRHLPTPSTPTGRISRGELSDWLEDENDRGIRADAAVPAELSDAVAASSHLLVSPLRRAQETAALVLAGLTNGDAPSVVTIDELREAPLPVLGPRRLRLRVPLDAWDVLCRTAWLAGWSGGVESRRQVSARVREVATQLDHLVEPGSDTTVTVIAHGFLNAMLAQRLRRTSWSGPRLPSHHHGQPTAYTR